MNIIKKTVLGLFVFALLLTMSPVQPVNAQTTSHYSNAGSYSVSTKTVTGYSIYYPSSISSSNEKFPVITWGNGTGAATISYSTLLNQLASHGFIVIATSSTMNQTGSSMLSALTYIENQNKTSNSIFYQKVNVDKMGSTGHSQGGGGSINSGSDSRLSCIAPIMPSPGSASSVKCPMFLITGTNDMVVNSRLLVKPSYTASKVATIYGSIRGASHLAPNLNPTKMKGYLTAWFCAFLKDDATAMSYFSGDNYKLKNDSDWTDVNRKNFNEVGIDDNPSNVSEANTNSNFGSIWGWNSWWN